MASFLNVQTYNPETSVLHELHPSDKMQEGQVTLFFTTRLSVYIHQNKVT